MNSDSFRNRRNGFETMDGGGRSSAPKKPLPSKKIIGGVVLAVVLIILGFNCTYEIKEQEQAVLITLGSPQAVTEPGLHFKIPFIQQVRKVNTTIQGLAIGYSLDSEQYNEDESLMITSDFNFIDVDFYVEYRFSDPVKALYASKNPLGILKNISQSCIRTVIGSYSVDDVLTTGKNEIQSAIKEMILDRLAKQDIGVQLVNITIQDSEPPTQEVMEAFKAVETAKQGKETALNNANKYRNEQLPSAQARADGIIKDAEAQKTERINEAAAQVSRFNAMYQEYIKNPVITRQRMFYEAMEDVLPDLKVVIEGSGGNMQTIYPLDSFTGGSDENGGLRSADSSNRDSGLNRPAGTGQDTYGSGGDDTADPDAP